MTYSSQSGAWNWGSYVGGQFGLGRNANGYAPGNVYTFDSWGTRTWNRWLSTSLRTVVEIAGNIDGADPDLNPMMAPTANPNFRGSKNVDLRTRALPFYTEAMARLDTGARPDAVIEAFKKDIDRTLLRENLKLSVEDRLRQLMELQKFAEELERAGAALRRSK